MGLVIQPFASVPPEEVRDGFFWGVGGWGRKGKKNGFWGLVFAIMSTSGVALRSLAL